MELLEALWHHLIGKAFSFVIKDKLNRVVGVALNFDANDEPTPPNVQAISILYEFVGFVEVSVR